MVIRNTGDSDSAIVSITNIKVTYTPVSEEAGIAVASLDEELEVGEISLLSISADTAAYAVMSLSMEENTAEEDTTHDTEETPDAEVPEEEQPKPGKPEKPGKDKPAKPEKPDNPNKGPQNNSGNHKNNGKNNKWNNNRSSGRYF